MLSPNVLRLLLRVSCVLALLLGLIVALVPSEQVPIHFWDKAEHASGMLLLTLYFGFAWQNMPLLCVAIVMVGYGIMIELLQLFTPWRDASVLDVVADACGALPACCLLALPFVSQWRKKLFEIIPFTVSSS